MSKTEDPNPNRPKKIYKMTEEQKIIREQLDAERQQRRLREAGTKKE